jgi:hypothetical protein
MTAVERIIAAPVASGGLEWIIRDSVPPSWPEAMQVCGGGFFHSPPGLLVAGPRGSSFVVDLWRGNTLVGISAGVRHGCKLSRRPLHVYIPTLPAMRDPRLREAGLSALLDAMRAEGADEIVVDTFGSPWSAGEFANGEATARRIEYTVRLDSSFSSIPARFASTHRRHCTKGERLGWTMRAAHGSDAAALLAEVQKNASERAAARGNEFEPGEPAEELFDRSHHADAWGVTAFAARDGETLLAVVLVGWANRGAFYISGGSTPQGYAAGAAPWLHWRVMRIFADRGFTSYNLGGTPAGAVNESDPSHGLWRFKTGFGAITSNDLSGMRREFDSAHMRAHQVNRWVHRRYPSWLR